MIIGLMAMDGQNGIGVNNTIPWNNKHDMLHFKQTTMNQDVVIGSTTYLGLIPLFKNEVLPGRRKFVLSRRDYIGNEIGFSFSEILQIYKPTNNLYIIGGKTVYDTFAAYNLYDELIITFIDGTFNCDTFLPISIMDSCFSHIQYFNVDFKLTSETYIPNAVIRTYKNNGVVDQQ